MSYLCPQNKDTTHFYGRQHHPEPPRRFETQKILKDYELDDFSQAVKNYYDGYKFYDKEMFCPWNVVNFIKDNWVNADRLQMNENGIEGLCKYIVKDPQGKKRYSSSRNRSEERRVGKECRSRW